MPIPPPEAALPEGSRLAVFGGLYSNHLALASALADAQRRGADAIYCLGDLGAFGPHPDRVFPWLHAFGVRCIQGNYDYSIGHELADCQCGYTDPRDNYFARISYEYTLAHTSPPHREWLRQLPAQRRLQLGRYRLLLCHGSPRRTNEFLWESTTPTHFLQYLTDAYEADVILATHTGIKWHRSLRGDRHFVNVGVLGRPENDGRTNVWYALLRAEPRLVVEFVPVVYDHERLAREMRQEGLPEEFVATILTGWWTTCLEVLPAKERRRGRF
ncbi:MAG: metallophosphatase family protein [Gemmataceae bacterium]|nr:metallophosphatase family protein [Gemmataceae bacterium]MDW8266562.1 metallophosphoesterase family protein [Gemmataceae bacterium]